MGNEWKCPQCGAYQRKPFMWKLPFTVVVGNIRCSNCGAACDAAHVRAGKYDPGVKTGERRAPEWTPPPAPPAASRWAAPEPPPPRPAEREEILVETPPVPPAPKRRMGSEPIHIRPAERDEIVPEPPPPPPPPPEMPPIPPAHTHSPNIVVIDDTASFSRRAQTTSHPVRTCGCTGCLGTIVILFSIYLLVPGSHPRAPVLGPDYSSEVKRLFGGNAGRLQDRIEQIPPSRLRPILRTTLVIRPFEGLYTEPQIPPAKLANARASCKVPSAEKVLGLYDATALGSAKNALIFGERGIYYSNSWTGNPQDAAFLPYSRFPLTRFKTVGTDLVLAPGHHLGMSSCVERTGAMVDLLSRVSRALLDAAAKPEQ